MSVEAHKGQILPLANQAIPLSKDTAFYASYDRDLNASNQGQKISPVGEVNALYFDGTTYIEQPALDIEGKTQFSFCTWLYTPRVSVEQMFVGWGDSGNYARLLASKVVFSLKTNVGGQTILTTGLSLTNNRWYHIACTYDGANMKIYVDGTEVATQTKTGVITGKGIPTLGIWNLTDRRPFQGRMSGLSQWDRGLIPDEIRSIMNGTIRGTEPGLLGYWKMNEGDGSVIYDASLYGNDSAIVGSYEWQAGPSVVTLRSDGRYGGAVAIEESSVNQINPKEFVNNIPLEWSVTKLDDYTFKCTALVNAPSTVGYPVKSGIYSAVANESVTMSCEIVETSNPNLTVGANGFAKLDGYGTIGKRIFRTIAHNAAWKHQFGIVYTNTTTAPLIKAGDYITVRNLQIESKAYPTSFVDGARPAGVLQYPSSTINKTAGTIACWIYYIPNQLWRRVVTFVDAKTNKDGQSDLNFDISPANKQVRLRAMNIPSVKLIMGKSSLPSYEWVHIACSWGAEGLKVYVNGILDGTNNSHTSGIASINPWISVGSQGDGYGHTNGLIQELRIDTVQASDDEIMSWYYSNAPFYDSMSMGRIY